MMCYTNRIWDKLSNIFATNLSAIARGYWNIFEGRTSQFAYIGILKGKNVHSTWEKTLPILDSNSAI